MPRMRRASGILAGTEAQGLSAHFAAGAQVFSCSRAAISRDVKKPARPRCDKTLLRHDLEVCVPVRCRHVLSREMSTDRLRLDVAAPVLAAKIDALPKD